jgi:3',5'-cyclic AMP phosphodiesterase CpdA
MLFSRLGSTAFAAAMLCSSMLCFSLTQAQPPAKAPKKSAVKATTPPPAPPSSQSDDQKFAERAARLWCLQPVKRPDVPAGLTKSTNPIDAFIAEQYRDKGLQPAPGADRLTLLRRVTLDLTGLPPAPADQDAFLTDTSAQAWDRVVDRLLADPQHGVRWARHWLDILRYADQDSGMPAASGIYLWRDWVIGALNRDMPYDDFVRAQIVGSRYKEHSTLTATGHRQKVPGPLEDQFALGFLARAALTPDNSEQDLALNSVETISTAFMGLTVGCAKCHDHKFDPIRQKDFYAMKAIFDPLVVKRVVMATPAEIFANGNELAAYRAKKAPLDDEIETLVAPYRTKLYDERVAMLPPDVQAAVRKPEKLRTVAEQKTFDDYYPILRIDASKIKEILPPPDLEKYTALLRQQTALGAAPQLPSYWTVEEDSALLKEPSYILTTGDPMRPEKDHPVEPGFPFKPESADFREGRREGFVDWLTAADNPLFARVAVNRVWAWHFGEGLEKSTSDFGLLGGTPSNRKLLDYLASEFVEHRYSMKWLHRLIVTSDTYRLASRADASVVEANAKADARDTYLWHFRLQRLEAEPIWDGILSAAGDLDTTVGGKSFQMLKPGETSNRRAIYMSRGYVPSTDVMANFLLSFDVDDGRTPCPIRTQTVTAPQALFTMNDDAIEKATAKFSSRVLEASSGDIRSAVDLAYRTTLGRAPTGGELDSALTYLANDPARMKGLAWMLFNLDEFIYVR